MNKLKTLMQEIINLSSEIETNYPELYVYLLETPLLIGNNIEKNISTLDLATYLETLKSQLKHHIQTHKEKN